MIYLAKLNDNYVNKEVFDKVAQPLSELFTKFDIEHEILEERDSYSRMFSFERELFVVSAEQYIQLTMVYNHFAIVQQIDMTKVMPEMFTRIEDKQTAVVQKSDTYNSHCEVHIPGSALSLYNETLLLEDSCTDALQSEIDNGWRIIACCPQAQRRPDYILGRYNPERTV